MRPKVSTISPENDSYSQAEVTAQDIAPSPRNERPSSELGIPHVDSGRDGTEVGAQGAEHEAADSDGENVGHPRRRGDGSEASGCRPRPPSLDRELEVHEPDQVVGWTNYSAHAPTTQEQTGDRLIG